MAYFVHFWVKLLECLDKIFDRRRDFAQERCCSSYEDQDFASDFPGRSATFDVEYMVVLIISPGGKCYIVCGEQKLYISLLMEEGISIFVVLWFAEKELWVIHVLFYTLYIFIHCEDLSFSSCVFTTFLIFSLFAGLFTVDMPIII